MMTETRKVQIVGGTTLIVSLPKEWTTRAELKPGDELFLVPKGDSSLLIKLKKDEKYDSRITLEKEREDEILSLIVASYLAGYKKMKIVQNEDNPDIKSFIRNKSWKFMGCEISEESSRELTLTTLLSPSAMKANNSIKRMLNLVSTMHENAVKSFINADVCLAEDTINSDDDVDRLNLLVVRQLLLAQGELGLGEIGIDFLEDTLTYRSVVKDLEKIGDYAFEIAKKVSSGYRLPETLSRELSELSELVSDSFKCATNSFLSNDIELARKVFEKEEQFNKKMETFLNSCVTDSTLDSVRLIKLIQVVDLLHETIGKSKPIVNETYNRYVLSQLHLQPIG